MASTWSRLGLKPAEIDGLMLLDDDEDLAAGEAPAPQPLETAVSRLGDLWVLGDHRLAHGDARDAALYDQLMRPGEFAQLVLTDEPYNVANVGHVTSNADHREFAFAHGEMSREEFAGFNRQWMEAVLGRLVDGGLFATFIDWRSIDLVLACGRELGLDLINVVVWVKTNGGQGSLWRSQHELLPVFKKGDEPHINNVELGRHGRWRSNVWEYAGASSLGSDAREGLALHPTVKPRLLLEDALIDVTNRGDIVIDCFAGSGSTLVAAEATGRRCRAIEFDGPYCDVIIRRWSEMTGRDAVLEATGETFAEVEARRRDEGPPDPAPQSARAEDDVAPDELDADADDRSDRRHLQRGGPAVSSNKPKKTPKGDYAVGYASPPKANQFQPGQSGNLGGPAARPAVARRAAAGGGGAGRQIPGRRQGHAHGPRSRADAQAVRYGPHWQGPGDPVGHRAPGAGAGCPRR